MRQTTFRATRPGVWRVVEAARDAREEGLRFLAMLGAGLIIGLLGAPRFVEGSAPHRPSLEDSPGYVRSVDPESIATALGRRTNAPLVTHRFKGGARSLDQLGRAVCRAIHRGDRDSLLALCVTDDEFRDILWREFPQSRPATGLAWEDGWSVLSIRLLAGCNQAVVDHGGRYHEFVRFESDTTSRFRNFDLHGGLTMVVKDDQGEIQRWKWLRSVAKRKGAFKIYSTDD